MQTVNLPKISVKPLALAMGSMSKSDSLQEEGLSSFRDGIKDIKKS